MKPALLFAFTLLLALLSGCRPPVAIDRDVTYGTVGGAPLLLDVYRPNSSARRSDLSAVVVVHGGGWSEGDKKECRDLALDLARQGYAVFCPNYRLVTATGNFWPAQLQDCQRAVRWVRAQAAHYGVNPAQVGAVGGSAGGHLVVCLGTMPACDDPEPALAGISCRPTCVATLCGPTDLTDDFAPKVKEGAWTNEVIRSFLGHPADFAKAARAASPLFFVDAQSAPTLIYQGKTDPIVPVDQAQRLHDALEQVHVPSELLLSPGGHGFDDSASLVEFVSRLHVFLHMHLKS